MKKYMSNAAHIRSTRWEPQLDAKKIHELGGRILRLLHCEKILHGFHFQATLFKLRMPWNLSITASFSIIVTALFRGMSAKRGSNGGCIVPGFIAEILQAISTLGHGSYAWSWILGIAWASGVVEVRSSDHQISVKQWTPPRFPSINLVLASVSQVDGVVFGLPKPL